jgi:signal transduction histidine kinase
MNHQATARNPAPLAWGLGILNLVLLGGLIAIAILNRESLSEFLADSSTAIVSALVFSFTGGVIASRHPRNPVAWLMLGLPLFDIVSSATHDYARHALVIAPGSWPGGDLASWIASWTWVPLVVMGALLLMLLPNGRPVSRRWRWLIYVTLAEGALILVGFMATWPLRGVRMLGQIETLPGLPAITRIAAASGFVLMLIFLAGIASMIVRFVRSRGEERQQLKWITFGVAVLGLTIMVGISFGGDLPVIVDAVAILILTAAIAIAILKYRLYDIDLVINKTLVYGSMAAFITAVYVAIVVGIGRAIGSDRNIALSIVATAVVAVAFQPVRERVQRFANRVVYGKRATPYEVLSEFSGGMSHTVATEDLLPRMARIVAEGTGAARADVWLRLGPDLVREASWPQTNAQVPSVVPANEGPGPTVEDADAAVPVRHQGELLGVIGIKKSPGEAVTPTETKLLEDLASQAGLVLRNVRLIEELRTSRQRLVTAQDEERRRLERDLHDGAQQRLVAISLGLRMARGLVDAEEDAALGERLDQASEELTRALGELREFARGIHPAILTERGLVPALHSLAERSTVPATVDANLEARLPAPVEATAYFVVSEALANVAKYSKATAVSVRAGATDGVLAVEVIDDGIGGADPSRGSGLRGLADRVAAVDGTLKVESPPGKGTRLTVRIPVPAMAEVPA